MTESSEVNIEAPPPGQPHNPYTEAVVLKRHNDIVRLLHKLDNNRCISSGEDGLVIIWDVKSGSVLHVLEGHTLPITCVLVLEKQTESLLLTAASDKHIRLWNTDTGMCVQVITEHDSSVKCLVQLSETGVFCSGGEKLCLWNNQGKLMYSYTREGQEADIHLMIKIKNERIITASDKDIVCYGIVTSTSEERGSVKEIRLIKYVPHNREPIRSLVSISESCFASGSLDGAIIIWSTQTMTPSRIFNSVQDYEGEDKLYPYSIQSLMVLEERFLFAATGCGFCGFDLHTNKIFIKKDNAHYSKVLHLEFVMEGLFLATCSEDCTLRLWGMPPNCDLPPESGQQWQMTDPTKPTVGDPIRSLTGKSSDELKMCSGQVFSPPLIGELLGHYGPIKMFMDYGKDGLFTCGGDGLIIVWKNAILQSLQRNEIVRNLFYSGEIS